MKQKQYGANRLAGLIVFVGLLLLTLGSWGHVAQAQKQSDDLMKFRQDQSEAWQVVADKKFDLIMAAIVEVKANQEYTRWIGGITLTAVLAYIAAQIPGIRRRGNGSTRD